MTPNLTETLSRIYYRELLEPWTLSENQLQLLELASGEEIAEIAYTNQWKLSTLLINADKMIDEHNEKIQRKVLKDLKKLTFDLNYFSPRPKTKMPRNEKPDSDMIERQILEETINEILENAPVSDEGITLDFLSELRRRQILGPNESFPGDEFASSRQNVTPSLQRDEQMLPVADNITLHQVISAPLEFHTIPGVEPFEELSLEQIAQQGMLEGSYGKQLYQSMKDRETPKLPAPIIDVQTTPLPEINRTNDAQITPIVNRSNAIRQHISPKVMETLQPLNRKTLPGNQSPLPTLDKSLDLAEMRRTDHVVQSPGLIPPQAAVEQGEIEKDLAGSKQLSNSIPHNSSQRLSRRDLFERLAFEVDRETKALMDMKVEKRRRQRRVKRRSVSPVAGNQYELIRPLIRHKRKPKIAKLSLPQVHMRIDLDIFDDLEDFVEDDPLWDQNVLDDQQNEVEMMASDSRKRNEKESLPKESKRGRFDSGVAEFVSPLAPKEKQVTRKLDEFLPTSLSAKALPVIEIDQEVPTPLGGKTQPVMLLDEVMPTPLAVERSPSLLPAHRNAKSNAFSPKHVSTTRKDPQHYNRLTANEMELAELRYSALAAEEVLDINDLINSMRRSQLPPIQDVQIDVPVNAVEKKFRYVKGRYQWGTQEFVEFKRDNGTIDRHSLYGMETIGFYLQIRFILARNQWKMKFTQLFPQLKLLDASKPEKVVESRIWALADLNFLKLHWDEQCENIIDVEIEVKDD